MSECSEYVDALDHIMRTARASRTQTRRLRWIAERARCALDGGDWKEIEEPRHVWNKERMTLRVRELEAALTSMVYFSNNHWYAAMHTDSDVTDEVGHLLQEPPTPSESP